jgi:hypothetical protein
MRLMMTWAMMLSQRDDRMNPSVTKRSMKRQNEIRAKAELAAENPA